MAPAGGLDCSLARVTEGNAPQIGRTQLVKAADPVRAAFIDHITIRIRNLEASGRFYEAAASAFGGRAVELETGEVSFGPEGSEDLAHRAR